MHIYLFYIKIILTILSKTTQMTYHDSHAVEIGAHASGRSRGVRHSVCASLTYVYPVDGDIQNATCNLNFFQKNSNIYTLIHSFII